jgi:hypothetical protein
MPVLLLIGAIVIVGLAVDLLTAPRYQRLHK